MTQVTEWSFRETVLIAVIIDQGHVPAFDVAQGWVRCRRCGQGWSVRNRVAQAESQFRLWGSPLTIAACSN